MFTFIAQNYEKFVCKCKLFVVLFHELRHAMQYKMIDEYNTQFHFLSSKYKFNEEE